MSRKRWMQVIYCSGLAVAMTVGAGLYVGMWQGGQQWLRATRRYRFRLERG